MIHLFGGLVAGLAIALILLGWRLSSGPISLAFMSSPIESALSTIHKSIRVRLDDTVLTWAGWDRTLDIRVLNVRAVGPDDAVIARVPQVSLSLSVQAMLRGLVAPRSVELFGPSLRIVRNRDGTFSVGFAGPAAGGPRPFKRIVDELLADLDPSRATSYLSRIAISDADLVIIDKSLATSWSAPAADLALYRDGADINGEMSLDLDIEGQKAQVTVLAGYQRETGRMDAGITFSKVTPALFSRLSEQLEPLRLANLPLKGTVTVSMKVDGDVESVGFDLMGGAGYIGVPEPFDQVLGVDTLELKGRYEGDAQVLSIDRLAIEIADQETFFLASTANHEFPLRKIRGKGRLDLGKRQAEIHQLDMDLAGPKASMTASIEKTDGVLTFRAKTVVRDVPVDALPRYWPKAWGTPAQVWSVANLSNGAAREVRAELELRSNSLGEWFVNSLTGDMDLENVSVRYLDGMPNVHKVNGTAKFNKKRFDVFVTGGESTGLTVTKGTIFITDLDQYDQYADVDLLVDGPLQNAMALIDAKPLRFASDLGLDPGKTQGRSSTNVKLRFLVERALTKDQVEVSAAANLTDVAIKGGLFGSNVSDGQLKVQVDKKGMDISGTIKYGTIPAAFSWRRNFTEQALFRRRFDLSGRVNDEQRITELGLDFPPLARDQFKGSMDAHVRYTDIDGTHGELSAELDLSDVAMEIPQLAWTKNSGVPGRASVRLKFKEERVAEISRFTVTAGDLKAGGSARFSPTNRWPEQITFDHLTYARTNMKGSLKIGREGYWQGDFSGSNLDIAANWEEVKHGDEKEKDKDANYRIAVKFDRVWLGPKQYIDNVSGELEREGEIWRRISIDGESGKGKARSLQISITPGAKGQRNLLITAKDAGAALFNLDIYENMLGGELRVTGKFDDSAPGRPLKGHANVKNYRVIKAPALAHLVSIMALTGIVDLLQGEGLGFAVLDVPFTLQDKVLNIKDARATGASLGFTAEGTILPAEDKIDIIGTAVPAYVINSFFGKIPVIGQIFSGGEKGGGIFAASYKMKGDLEKPEVTVNPLTALAPGFLRNLLNIFDVKDSASGKPKKDAAPAEPTPQPVN